MKTVNQSKRDASNKRYRIRNPQGVALRSKKAHAKAEGAPFDYELMKSIPCPTHCPVLGTPIKFELGVGHRNMRNTASYDQIIPGIGYVEGNVLVVSKQANTMKSNATPHELLRFAQWVISEYGYLLDTAPPV